MSTHSDEPVIARDDCGPQCQEALDRLFEYIDSELGQPDAERIRVHLRECTPCLEEFDTEAVVKKLVRRSCREAAPVELRGRIHAQLVAANLQVRPEGSRGSTDL